MKPQPYEGYVCPRCDRFAAPYKGGHESGCEYGRPGHRRGACPDKEGSK